MELKEEEVLLLGAFLHDIGKFVQRALADPHEKTHAQLSREVVKKLLEFLDGEDRERIERIVGEHHESVGDRLGEIVTEADRIAAGERLPREFAPHEKISEFRLRQPLGVLGCKSADSLGISTLPMFPLASLRPDEGTMFPIEKTKEKGHYEGLWKGFADEVVKLPQGSFEAFFLSLYNLLYKYTWCVPSAAFRDYPTISLFDHSRMTAAMAWCLYKGDAERPFMFIKGDLGGIQNFIYSIASPDDAQEGMAKRLRGRSFYLSLIAESVARFIMDKLRLPEPNLIWLGGGGFLILAPNSEETRCDLKKAIGEIETELLYKHHGQLSLAVAYCEASKDDMAKPTTDKEVNFKKLMEKLGDELEKAKEKKFKSQGTWPTLPSEGETECIVCAAPMKENEGKIVETDDGKKKLVLICPDCQRQERIGKALPGSNYLLWTTESWNPSDGAYVDVLGQRWCLLGNPPANPPSKGILYRIKGMNFLEEARKEDTVARGFRFIATHVPGTFEEMAEKADGMDYLAALRMDVDDMGYLLATVQKEFQTPSFYASVSRLLDLFFSGYMNTMIRGNDALYIVYAGGDDLFIVGAWDKVLAKALEISQKFGKYTGNPENLHLSGGYYIFKPKFPIGRAAEGAGEAEDDAKKGKKRRKCENKDCEKQNQKSSTNQEPEGKNALCAFNEVFRWDEVKEALNFSAKLHEYLADEKISRSFVQTLLNIYHNDYKECRLIWAARVIYQLARNVSAGKSAKTPEEREKALAEAINYLHGKLVRGEPGKEIMKTAQLWANVVLLKTREKPKNQKEEKR